MNALAIRNTLKSTGARAAEAQLALISHEQGDEQLAVIVSELSPGEIGVFLGEGDYTKPSQVTAFVSPEQLVGALERIGAKWGDLNGSSLNALINLKREVSDLLLPVLLHAEPAHRNKLLTALLKNSLAEDVVVSLPLFEHGCPEFLADFEAGLCQHGSWQEVYSDIHALNEKFFEKLRREVLSLFPKTDGEGEGEGEEEEEDPTESRQAAALLKRTLQALANRAAKLVEAHPEESENEDVFRTI